MFKFWILDHKECLKKLGIGSGLYRKSVLYLMHILSKKNPQMQVNVTKKYVQANEKSSNDQLMQPKGRS